MKRGIFLVGLSVLATAVPSWAGDGVVALQTADPSCRTTTTPPPRYVDCGNGTVTDNDTGLVWLANANCFGQLDWHQAMETVAGLGDLPDGELCFTMSADDCDCGLSDGSSAGEWRLATIGEWLAMIGSHCNPAISDDAGNGCWHQDCVLEGGCSFYGVSVNSYWSSSPYVPDLAKAWLMGINGFLNSVTFESEKTGSTYVWPVRNGQ